MKRRRFLATALASTVTLPLIRPAELFAGIDSRYLENIGLQLWTVRNQLAEDIPKTLKSVADAGYKQVELMNVMDADSVVPVAKDLGMKATSAFIDWQSIGNPEGDNVPAFDRILEKASKLDLKYLIFGYIGKGHRETEDHYKGHAERANRAGEKCKQAGIKLCYHNHSFEFQDLGNGSAGWDILSKRFDNNLVQFEVDVFWVQVGGRDPIAAMKLLDGRVAQVHLKDMKKGTGTIYDEGQVPADAFQELGDGTIDMQQVLRVAEEIGVRQCHVEQDQSPDPVASVGQSLKYLNQLN